MKNVQPRYEILLLQDDNSHLKNYYIYGGLKGDFYMAVSFGGIASGLPVNDIIDATINAKAYRLNKYEEDKRLYNSQKSALDTIEAKYNSLESTIEKITDSKLISAFDLFNKKQTDLSDSSIATVTTGSNASSGSIEVEVNSLVKNPKLSVATLAGNITPEVKLYDLGIIEGTFSVAFEDTTNNKGILLEIEIDTEDTIQTLFDNINTAVAENEDLSGTVASSIDASGQVILDFSALETNGIVLDNDNPLGNSTSNISDVFGFTPTGSTLTATPKTSLNLDGTLFGNNANINGWNSDGNIPETINIGGTEIEITETTTLREIMTTVNEDEDCQVEMRYNQALGNIVFEGKDDFYSDYIYFSGNTLLSELGATVNGTTDTTVQTARQPGEVVIDGETLFVKSNKLTPAETGIKGVTITLNKVTQPDEPLDISIYDSTEELEAAMENLVNAYNSIVDTVEQYTFSDTETEQYGVLRTEYTIQRMQNDIRTTLMSGLEEDLEFKAMSLVGISGSDDGSGHLEFDKTEFLDAINQNKSDVKALLIGNSEGTIEGVLEKIQSDLEMYLDIENGYFSTKDSSLNDSITSLNKSITAEEERLEQIRERLVQQYSNLDSTISNYNSQGAALANL